MSKLYNWNRGWKFTKDAVTLTEGESILSQAAWEDIDLPHTWNGTDGQDGGNDYYRHPAATDKSCPKTIWKQENRFTFNLMEQIHRPIYM